MVTYFLFNHALIKWLTDIGKNSAATAFENIFEPAVFIGLWSAHTINALVLFCGSVTLWYLALAGMTAYSERSLFG